MCILSWTIKTCPHKNDIKIHTTNYIQTFSHHEASKHVPIENNSIKFIFTNSTFKSVFCHELSILVLIEMTLKSIPQILHSNLFPSWSIQTFAITKIYHFNIGYTFMISLSHILKNHDCIKTFQHKFCIQMFFSLMNFPNFLG